MIFAKTSAQTLVVFLTLAIWGCVTAPQPVEDYSFARAALEAARLVEAPRHSPGYFHQAEEAFRRGQSLFEERSYDLAKIEFRKSRVAAERAENSARLIRAKTGEVF